ncbi:MAG TPA: helix-turn-helix transcriptional regulator [Thermoanaerobaculia bacterium]|nr:helix-turn-helix transcriptional regulator [Thermoanaerobaculia bacterium]
MDRPPPTPKPLRPGSPLAAVGPALRRLRMQRGRRQFETAAAAGITKAMLSAYENGKRRPSLKTLDQILGALDADLGDLHLAIVRERREAAAARAAGSFGDELAEPAPAPYTVAAADARPRPEPPFSPPPSELDLYRALGVEAPLPAAQERALSEMLLGFLRLLRHLHAGADDPDAGRTRSPYAP